MWARIFFRANQHCCALGTQTCFNLCSQSCVLDTFQRLLQSLEIHLLLKFGFDALPGRRTLEVCRRSIGQDIAQQKHSGKIMLLLRRLHAFQKIGGTFVEPRTLLPVQPHCSFTPPLSTENLPCRPIILPIRLDTICELCYVWGGQLLDTTKRPRWRPRMVAGYIAQATPLTNQCQHWSVPLGLQAFDHGIIKLRILVSMTVIIWSSIQSFHDILTRLLCTASPAVELQEVFHSDPICIVFFHSCHIYQHRQGDPIVVFKRIDNKPTSQDRLYKDPVLRFCKVEGVSNEIHCASKLLPRREHHEIPFAAAVGSGAR
mmetsp:Transcript_98984/g.171536  ORF Transcript_98984/g.171536 Transcript_98984/m.171536 type:complete len:316 (-) Transcript_98984:283-1230(-)